MRASKAILKTNRKTAKDCITNEPGIGKNEEYNQKYIIHAY